VNKPKTLVSKHGVLQNPTGQHEGKRVWGGGIVRISPQEWIAWPIDNDDEANLEGESFMGAAPTKGVYKSPAAKISGGRQTEHAFGANLNRIKVGALEQGGGNVLSGAIPPWLKKEEVKLFPELVSALSEALEQKRKPKNPNRIGAAWADKVNRMKRLKSLNISELTEEPEENHNWLPNFGRVFNEGPRRMTAHEFRGEQLVFGSTTNDTSPVPTEEEEEDEDGHIPVVEHVEESDSHVTTESAPKVIYGPLI